MWNLHHILTKPHMKLLLHNLTWQLGSFIYFILGTISSPCWVWLPWTITQLSAIITTSNNWVSEKKVALELFHLSFENLTESLWKFCKGNFRGRHWLSGKGCYQPGARSCKGSCILSGKFFQLDIIWMCATSLFIILSQIIVDWQVCSFVTLNPVTFSQGFSRHKNTALL